MKACVLHSIGDLRVEDVESPHPGNNEVLIQIKASGICGSDIARVFTKGTYKFPTIPGHEFSGIIAELGRNVDKALLGRKVAVFPLLPCKKCDACHIGEYALCSNYNYFGSRCDGGFAEYIAVPVWNIVTVPDNISFEEAAMTEPLAVAIHALRQAGIEIGDDVAIFGAGPIGLMLAKWASIWGAGRIMLLDIDKNKVDFAKHLGFDFVFNSLEGDAVKWVTDITGGKGADVSIEGAGVSETLKQCLLCSRSFGRVVVMGNPTGDIKLSQKAYWEILRKQLTIKGTWNSSYGQVPKNDWIIALSYIERGLLDIKPLITHRFSLDECGAAFDMMRERKTFYNKVMFIINPDK